MKKSLFTLLLSAVLLTTTVHAQDAFDTQMKVYTSALKYYDLNAAASALYNAMALKPDRKDLRDSLALIYFAGERYGQAYTVGEEILKDNPKRSDILEMVAVSKQSLGLIKESLEDYEALYKADSKQIFYLYQIATLQYQLKRYGECVASLDQIIGNDASAKQNVNIRNSNGSSQAVPMKAAALNVKGIVAMDLNQDANAKDLFNKALEIFPDFVLAKGNLAQLSQPKNPKELGPPTKSTPAPRAAGQK